MFSSRSDEFVKSDRMDDYCGTTERPIVERPLPQRGSKESDAGTISDFDQALDEFGRKIIPKQPSTPVWPPCFETHGSSFTFDTRSSMFYENESDFFYDPKSKLYYGNKSQIYYRYDPFATPFFVEVQKIDESKMTVASENEIIHAPGKPSSTYSKPPTISINIKSKSLKVKKKQRTEDIKPDRATPAVSIPFRAKKKHETDMEKWSNRQTEKQHDVERPVLGSVPAISSKVTRTANGEPICVLCQRKFPNLEKLKVHERASKLHQENLKKQGLSKRDNEEKQKNYADRAQQRRNMYGVESMPVCTVLPAIESTPIPTQLSATDTLGTSNIGNKMLQKLGWKEGNSIGRLVGQGSHHGSQQVQLAKEWERIEALADANMAKRPYR